MYVCINLMRYPTSNAVHQYFWMAALDCRKDMYV